ncbi:hypothetical protein FRB95_014017 [Tulasnella sp. JGI-2019a]|nr:hypothetical protein FRB95_014017 [Tulasnella sp. JGI-2019a]
MALIAVPPPPEHIYLLATKPDPLPFASPEFQHTGAPAPQTDYMTQQSFGQGSQTTTSSFSLFLQKESPRRGLSPSPAPSRDGSPSSSSRTSPRDQNARRQSRSPQRSQSRSSSRDRNRILRRQPRSPHRHRPPQRIQSRSPSRGRDPRPRSRSPQRHRSPQRSQSWLSYISNLSWSPHTMIISLSAFAISLAAIWCYSAGYGYNGVGNDSANTTSSFNSSDVPLEQIGLGNYFFDCLNELQFTRKQVHVVSRLTRVAEKVMQYEKFLENPQELSNSLKMLAHTHEEIVAGANVARLSGNETVNTIIREFRHAYFRSSTGSSPDIVQNRLRGTIFSIHESLRNTSDHIFGASLAVQTAKDVASNVRRQINQEISRLRDIEHESEKGFWYVLWDRQMDSLQPGKEGLKRDRKEAAKLLEEALSVVDECPAVFLLNAMSLKKCVVTTGGFKDQIEMAFTLDHDRLTIQAQLQYLLPSIESLETRVTKVG